MESFDFNLQAALDRQRVMALAALGFIERQRSVHLLGAPGIGKTYLATALEIAENSCRLREHADLVPETLKRGGATPNQTSS